MLRTFNKLFGSILIILLFIECAPTSNYQPSEMINNNELIITDRQKDITNILQDGLDKGKSIIIRTGTYELNKSILIRNNGTIIKGEGNVSIIFKGVGSALKFERTSTNNYPVNCLIERLWITVQNPNSIGIEIKASYSEFSKIIINLKNSDSVGFILKGDDKGSGSYYNSFKQCSVQGNIFKSSINNQIGIKFTYPTLYKTRCPNANSFWGGRIGQVDKGIIINGNGNNFYSPTLEGITQRVFEFDHAESSVGCVTNSVYSPYVEGAAGVTVGYFGKNSLSCNIFFPYITSIGSNGKEIEDVSTSQSNQVLIASQMKKLLPNLNPKDNNRVEPAIISGKSSPGKSSPNGTLYIDKSKGELFIRKNGEWQRIK